MRVAEWLGTLGLDHYQALFAENEIDWEVLPDLTAEDLESLGLPLGPRKKLLKAIAALSAQQPAESPAAQPTEAERRQLTVVFADLVASTRLSEELDPEDMGELIQTYQNTVTREIARFEGHVAKYMGDGVLAYFGWPKAYEDASERAVRAGIAIGALVGRLSTPSGKPLAARVGIATGRVVVGDLFGPVDGEAVVGDTPNLAARLQQIADPGGVVISQTTRRLVGGLFEVADLGTQPLKGFTNPVRAYRVIGESSAEGRFEALHGRQLAALVGRDSELDLLLNRFHRARAGEGQVVVLSGEAGIGKSRLLLALRERIAGTDYMPLSHFCSAHHANSAFYPIVSHLKRAAGFAPKDDGAARHGKLEALLALSTEAPERDTPLIAALLGLPPDPRRPTSDLTPQRQKELTVDVLVAQVAGLARRQPVLAVYEDVQWIDPSSLETIGALIGRIEQLPVLVLLTCRPEFTLPWQGRANVLSLSLTRLARAHAQAIIARVTGGKPLPAELVDIIVERSDGVPLFVEELTKTMLESGALSELADGFELSGPLRPVGVPSSLHDSLMARLDRLAPVREIAQIAAVIGRDFSRDLLGRVLDHGPAELDAALDRLAGAGLIVRRGSGGFSFRHALVQDAAYQSLLRRRRQAIHARVADALGRSNAGAAPPEIVAHHLTEAGLAAEAIPHWREAGQRALQRSATAEAIALFSNAIELSSTLEDGEERQRIELALQLGLASACVADDGIAAPAVGRAYARSRQLCDQLGDVPQWFAVRYGQCIYHLYRAELEDARRCADDLLDEADPDDINLRFYALRASGVAAFPRGDFALARRSLEAALRLYDRKRHLAPAFVYAFDPQVVCLDYLSRTLLALGEIDEAIRCHETAVAEARQRRHHNTVALPLFFGAMIFQFLGHRDRLEERLVELRELSRDQGLRLWTAGGQVLNGWVTATSGDPEAGLNEIEQGIAAWRSTGAECFVPYFLCLSADALTAKGERNRALKALKAAGRQIAGTGECWLEAERLRRIGELCQAEGQRDQAEAALSRALDVARTQKARLWEEWARQAIVATR